MIRILIADDHGIVRMGLKLLLETEPDFSVVGEARDGAEAVSTARKLKPDVVIMDMVMPVMDGATATREICATDGPPKVLLLSTFASSDDLQNAFDAGACGAVFKSTADNELAEAIRHVYGGDTYISPVVMNQLKTDPPIPQLTGKQLEILVSVMRGLSNDEIARQFGITRITVKGHLKVIFQKLGAANRTEAVAIALKKQLLKTNR